jgi:FkbM family methyltransferase
MTAMAVRRVLGDIRAVCAVATHLAAAQWLLSLARHPFECIGHRSLIPADRAWDRLGAKFRMPNTTVISLPPSYTAGAREMYCRNVYLRTGLSMPVKGWVVDLGANRGLFSVWAALSGAKVIALEAQQGFASEIRRLAEHNRVIDRISIVTAIIGGQVTAGASIGVIADDSRWLTTSHGTATRPAEMSVPQIMELNDIEEIALLKMDIEGSEFAVLSAEENLSWLKKVDQLVLEVHPTFGDSASLISRLQNAGFIVQLKDNEGNSVPSSASNLSYAYCSR